MTLPLNPLRLATVAVYVALFGRVTVTDEGAAASEKSGGLGLTVFVGPGVFVGEGVPVGGTGVNVGGTGVFVAVGELVGAGVLVAGAGVLVGPPVDAEPVQLGNLNEPMRVCQFVPFAA